MAAILLVEDDENLLAALSVSLRRAGHTVQRASSGPEAVAAFAHSPPDLVLLDVMLPGYDGLEVCRRIRQSSHIPILMLTARTEEIDAVLGLELGADDYIAKPVRVRELLARIGAALRRAQPRAPEAAPPAIVAGDLRLDPASHTAERGGRELRLKPRAFALLHFLMQHRGQVFSRDQLLRQLWGDPHVGDPRTVDVHIRWVRQQIEDDPSRPQRLRTIRGVGYLFTG